MTTTEGISAQMIRALNQHLERKVAQLEDAYDADYRREAPIGLAGPPSGVRTTSRLNDCLLTQTRKTGELTWTIHIEVDDTRAPHGKWIDQPTDLIVPHTAKVLRWFGYRTGQPIFAPSVVPSREHEGWWGRWTDRLQDITSQAWDRGI